MKSEIAVYFHTAETRRLRNRPLYVTVYGHIIYTAPEVTGRISSRKLALCIKTAEFHSGRQIIESRKGHIIAHLKVQIVILSFLEKSCITSLAKQPFARFHPFAVFVLLVYGFVNLFPGKLARIVFEPVYVRLNKFLIIVGRIYMRIFAERIQFVRIYFGRNNFFSVHCVYPVITVLIETYEFAFRLRYFELIVAETALTVIYSVFSRVLDFFPFDFNPVFRKSSVIFPFRYHRFVFLSGISDTACKRDEQAACDNSS